MIKINKEEYRDKVLACWLGKNIGGTLGMPMEWKRQINDVTFYTQDLKGDPVPNDDLDIQLLWLVALEEQGVEINAQTLSEYWHIYLTPHWAEYGISKSNMRQGLPAPVCGTFNNKYKDSCGAFIRSEIWACIAPGTPALAVKYAYEDAIIDHGNGDGTYAEVFCAALESAAFVISDIRQLIDIGLSYIPTDCGTAEAIKATIRDFDAGKSWQDIRDMILRDFRGHQLGYISPEDIKKGFQGGKVGYDAPSNMGILTLGLLCAEKGDFDEMICTTVNCGEDTDCTAATVGSIYGIINGTKGIPEKWIEPIGRSLKTCCLNLGELQGNRMPANVDILTDRVEAIAMQVLGRFKNCGVEITETTSTGLDKKEAESMLGRGKDESIYKNMNGPVYKFPFFSVSVNYGENPVVRSGEEKTVALKIENTYGRVQANISVRTYSQVGWQISPGSGVVPCFPGLSNLAPEIEISFLSEKITDSTNRFVVELTIEGRPGTMLVPIILLNGNFAR